MLHLSGFKTTYDSSADHNGDSNGNISASAETRNLRPDTYFRGTNETEFMLIFDYSELQKSMMAMLEQ